MVGEIAGTLARINECSDINYTCSDYIFRHLLPTIKKKKNLMFAVEQKFY